MCYIVICDEVVYPICYEVSEFGASGSCHRAFGSSTTIDLCSKEALGREAFRSSKSEIPDPSAGPRMIHDAAMM